MLKRYTKPLCAFGVDRHGFSLSNEPFFLGVENTYVCVIDS
jgi:hypothetical protein